MSDNPLSDQIDAGAMPGVAGAAVAPTNYFTSVGPI